jgi:hypothetical protein
MLYLIDFYIKVQDVELGTELYNYFTKLFIVFLFWCNNGSHLSKPNCECVSEMKNYFQATYIFIFFFMEAHFISQKLTNNLSLR